MKLRKTVVLLMFLSMFFVQSPQAEEKSKSLATINGENITQEFFDSEFGVFVKGRNIPVETMDQAQLVELKNKFLSDIVTSTLLFQESKKNDLLADEKMVDENYASFLKQYPEKMPKDELFAKLGMDEESLKNNMRRSLSIRNLIEKEIYGKVAVTDEDALLFYSQNGQFFKKPARVKASHILLKVEKSATVEEKKKMKDSILAIKAKLDAGDKFEDLAKAKSTCPSSEKGGDLGFFKKGDMVKPFEDAAFSMEEGQVSDIVETNFGYHIIKVTGKEKSSLTPLADVKEKILTHLKQKKGKEVFTEYLGGLMEKATINVEPFKVKEVVQTTPDKATTKEVVQKSADKKESK